MSKKTLKIECHICGNKTEVIAEEALIQAFTGREFCSEECWDEYLESEGLK